MTSRTGVSIFCLFESGLGPLDFRFLTGVDIGDGTWLFDKDFIDSFAPTFKMPSSIAVLVLLNMSLEI